MATLKIKYGIEIDGNPAVNSGAVVTKQVTLTNGFAFHVENLTVADNYGTKTLWTSGNGGITTFELGLILSTHDIWIEFRNDDSGTPEYARIFVKANVPTFFGAKAGGGTTEALDGAVLVDNTDYADIDRIEVQRDAADGVGDATVDLFLFN